MKQLLNITAVALACSALTLSAHAAGDKKAYALDSSGAPVKSPFGDCVRAGHSSSQMLEACGDAKPKMMAKDADNDGVNDDKDQCPGTAANARVDGNGCEFDSDNDGVVDSKDKCPSTAAGADVDASGCVVDGDSDGDGVRDSADRCAGTAAGAKVNEHGCAVDMDDDKDGIANAMDACPGTPRNTAVDLRGCELKEDLSLDSVEFATGTANLSGRSQQTLDNIARIMRENPHLKFEVGGHTDDRGAYQYNVSLSEKRAQSVRNYLTSKGVNGDRLTARGYGPDRPLVDNSTADGRRQNRRVELTAQ